MESDEWKVVGVNYWKNIPQSASEIEPLCLFINTGLTQQETYTLFETIFGEQLTYISLSKSFASAKPFLNPQNTFVDCFSKGLSTDTTDEGTYEISPGSLEDSAPIIQKYICDTPIIIDAISRYITLKGENSKPLQKFVETIRQTVANTTCILTYDNQLQQPFITPKLLVQSVLTGEKMSTGTVLWHDCTLFLKRTLTNMGNISFVYHNSAGFPEITQFVSKLPSTSSVLYISFVHSHNSIVQHTQELPYNLLFVDCVSGEMFANQSTDSVLFTETPYDLKQLTDLIIQTAEKNIPDCIIIDSLSQIISMTDEKFRGEDLIAFINELLPQLSPLSRVMLFYDHSMHKVIPHVEGIPATVLKMECVREKVTWVD